MHLAPLHPSSPAPLLIRVNTFRSKLLPHVSDDRIRRMGKKKAVNLSQNEPPLVDAAGLTSYFLRQKEVIIAYIFGSAARGRINYSSDVDLAVLLDARLGEEAQFEHYLLLAVKVADFSQRDVDLVLLNKASPLLAHEVIRHGRLIYERCAAERIDFEIRTRQIYFDVKPMLNFHSQALLRRIKEVGLGRRQRNSARTLEAARRIHREIKRAKSVHL